MYLFYFTLCPSSEEFWLSSFWAKASTKFFHLERRVAICFSSHRWLNCASLFSLVELASDSVERCHMFLGCPEHFTHLTHPVSFSGIKVIMKKIHWKKRSVYFKYNLSTRYKAIFKNDISLQTCFNPFVNLKPQLITMIHNSYLFIKLYCYYINNLTLVLICKTWKNIYPDYYGTKIEPNMSNIHNLSVSYTTHFSQAGRTCSLFIM